MRNNKTKKDAHERITWARTGSLGRGATPEYLDALRAELYKWVEEVESARWSVSAEPQNRDEVQS